MSNKFDAASQVQKLKSLPEQIKDGSLRGPRNFQEQVQTHMEGCPGMPITPIDHVLKNVNFE